MKRWVCDRLGIFVGATDGLGCAEGLPRSRCDRFGGPTSRNCGSLPLKQPMTPHKFGWPASVTWKMPRPGGQTPKLNIKN